jgi:hypothetical protein
MQSEGQFPATIRKGKLSMHTLNFTTDEVEIEAQLDLAILPRRIR